MGPGDTEVYLRGSHESPRSARPVVARLRAQRFERLLGNVPPELVERIELAHLRGEDVQHDVDVVGNDPRRLRLTGDRARNDSLLLPEANVHLVPDCLGLARRVAAAYH